MNDNRKIKSSAFTLVELLVVISIIAMLLAILMPSLQKAREQAKRVICASNLHNLSLSYFSYEATYNELPEGYWGSATLMKSDLHKILVSYGMTEDAVICPSADRIDYEGYNWEWGEGDYGLTTYCYLGGYGNASTPSIPQTDGWYNEYWWARDKGYMPRRSTIRHPAPGRMPLIQDIATPFENEMYAVGVKRSNHVSGGTETGRMRGTGDTYVKHKNVGQNIVFYDGHAEYQKLISGQS